MVNLSNGNVFFGNVFPASFGSWGSFPIWGAWGHNWGHNFGWGAWGHNWGHWGGGWGGHGTRHR
jgi:hypothetical protein